MSLLAALVWLAQHFDNIVWGTRVVLGYLS